MTVISDITKENQEKGKAKEDASNPVETSEP